MKAVPSASLCLATAAGALLAVAFLSTVQFHNSHKAAATHDIVKVSCTDRLKGLSGSYLTSRGQAALESGVTIEGSDGLQSLSDISSAIGLDYEGPLTFEFRHNPSVRMVLIPNRCAISGIDHG